jgi:C-terminal binding protein
MSVWITDYINNPSVEEQVLGKVLSDSKKHQAKVLLVWHQEINKKFISNFPNLKGVVRYGVGYDNIDVNLLKRKGIVFCNNPDYGVDEVSDTALAMILNFSRKISSYNHIAKSLHHSWQEQTIKSILRSKDTKVGIIGAGRIGSSLILKLNSLNYQTMFYDPYVPSGYEKTLNTKRADSLINLLKDSNFISLHCPLNSETKGMVDKKFISHLKKGSFIINTARGGLLLSNDLIYENIINGKIEGVGLDVTIDEPPLKGDKLINLWSKDNKLSQKIIINPHSAYYSKQSYKEMRVNAAKKALDILEGKTPKDIILSQS